MDEPLRTFRPRRGLIAAAVTGILLVGGCLVIELTARGPLGANPANRWAIALFAAVAATLLWRLGGVHATPSRAGLRVRNVVFTRDYEWAEVIAVRFRRADPWVRLDLADGSNVAVMGIQRSDGPRAVDDARRLAELVRRFGEAPDA